MPRIIPSSMLRPIAINFLLELYKQEQSFQREWAGLRSPYLPLVSELARAEALAEVNLRLIYLPWLERELLRKHVEARLEAIAPNLKALPPLHELEQEGERLLERLEPYVRQLAQLANSWKLRASWAGDELLNEDVYDIKTGIFKTLAISQETPLSSAYWSSRFLPALTIEVPSLSFIQKGRREILTEISKKLADYEAEIRDRGGQELPSRLKSRARWWFEHYVHGKTYDEISQSETGSPGGSLISYAKNVGRAVRDFAKLIDIGVKYLK